MTGLADRQDALVDDPTDGRNHLFVVYVVLGVAIAAVSGLVLWELVPLTGCSTDFGPNGERLGQRCLASDSPNRFRLQSLLTIVGAYAVAGAGYFTYRRATAAEAQAEAATRQVSVAADQLTQRRAEHETERYGRAIDQLGSESLVVRNGGLIALEALAVDAPARWAAIVYENLVEFLLASTVLAYGGATVQTTVRILSRQRFLFDTHVVALQADIPTGVRPATGVHLMGVSLADAHLEQANLINARLVGVDLSGAKMAEARLCGATLRNCRLVETDLSDADLANAHFDASHIVGAIVESAAFEHALISDGIFRTDRGDRASFMWARLRNVRLMIEGQQIRFDRAKLEEVDLRYSVLKATSFRSADLVEVNFGGQEAHDDRAVLDEGTRASLTALARMDDATRETLTANVESDETDFVKPI